MGFDSNKVPHVPPQKQLRMTMEKQEFQDVSPIKNGHIKLSGSLFLSS